MLWVEILNRSPEWLVTETMGAASMAGVDGCAAPRAPSGAPRSSTPLQDVSVLDPRVADALRLDFDVLRWLYAARALAIPVPAAVRASLEGWLEALRLQPEGPARWQGFGLPVLRARRVPTVLVRELDTLLSTALLQLACAANVAGVSRCHGVRQGTAPSVWGEALDAVFRKAAHLDRWLDSSWRQCPRLVFGQRGGHYCSKACSNAGFAARKGARDPGYFAAKQAQYRDRQRRRAVAHVADPGVLFVD